MSSAFARILTILLPFAVFAVIWIPEIARHHVPSTPIAGSTVEEGRHQVSDGVLDEIRAYRLMPRRWMNEAELIRVADKMLQGVAELPGYKPVTIGLPFESADLTKSSGLWRLQFAGLVVPEVLLDAYRQTGQEAYYEKARDVILAFGEFERKAWFDRGFLWNDHALAARARTIADFWAVYRHRPDYDPRVAAEIWRFATRTEEMLAKPENYTFATNHGVMQNVAIWHLCIAFPTLRNCEEDKQLALQRLTEEFSFYIAPDGVILEHSAEYHEFGVFLLGVALRYATLLNIKIPEDWASKYGLAKEFYGEIRRPDGSLPMFGDTGDQSNAEGIPITIEREDRKFSALRPTEDWKPSVAFQVYPLAGYALQWEGLESWPATSTLAQEFLVASYFHGHGHKHADELSILFWADGKNWWTNAGYWSYDDSNRIFAEGWDGSNAPHLANESPNSYRRASIVGSAFAEGIVAAEAERRGPGSFIARRLMVGVRQDVWIAADSYSGSAGKSVQAMWTTAPGISVEKSPSEKEFALESDTGTTLRVGFFGVPAPQLFRYRGSRTPFAGWVMHQGSPEPAEAFLVDQPSGRGCAFTVWRLDRPGRKDPLLSAPIASNVKCNGVTSWSIRVNGEAGELTVERSGDEIVITPREAKKAEPDHLILQGPSPEVEKLESNLERAYQAAESRYPRYRDLMEYRGRASLAMVLLLALQELGLMVIRWRWNNLKAAAQVFIVLSWTVIAIWLHWFYLAVY
jgi:hypothetical protein